MEVLSIESMAITYGKIELLLGDYKGIIDVILLVINGIKGD